MHFTAVIIMPFGLLNPNILFTFLGEMLILFCSPSSTDSHTHAHTHTPFGIRVIDMVDLRASAHFINSVLLLRARNGIFSVGFLLPSPYLPFFSLRFSFQ